MQHERPSLPTKLTINFNNLIGDLEADLVALGPAGRFHTFTPSNVNNLFLALLNTSMLKEDNSHEVYFNNLYNFLTSHLEASNDQAVALISDYNARIWWTIASYVIDPGPSGRLSRHETVRGTESSIEVDTLISSYDLVDFRLGVALFTLNPNLAMSHTPFV